jgi:ABC-type transport system substrate-binding protein
VFDKLADIGPDQNTIGDAGWTPRLARRWQWGADSMSITFHLDPGARWHDSVAVTATDVAFAFSVYTDSVVASSDGALMATLVDSLVVVDSATFVVWFGQARPERFYSLVYNLTPLPAHLLASVPRDRCAPRDTAARRSGTDHTGSFAGIRVSGSNWWRSTPTWAAAPTSTASSGRSSRRARRRSSASWPAKRISLAHR